MAPPRLSEAELAALATVLPLWNVSPGALVRDLKFADFSAAWGFMARVALLAEQQDHHPEWSNVYNRVHLSLNTHESGGVTGRDATLARAIDALGTT